MRTKTAHRGPRYQGIIQLLRTAETLWNASRAFFARWDLGPSQFNVLNLLYEQPAGLTQSDLSRQLLMHRSNVTGLVDRLEERKLVGRHDTPGDRRAYRVVLTDAGRKIVTEILPHYYRASEEVWGNMPVKRSSELVADLSQVCANAGQMAEALAKNGDLPGPRSSRPARTTQR